MKTKAKIISASVSCVILDNDSIMSTVVVVTESGGVYSFTGAPTNYDSWESFPVIWEVTDD